MMLHLTSNQSSEEDILLHLQRVNSDFLPPLSSRVDLYNYSARLKNLALREEGWYDNRLLSLVAGYINGPGEVGYISNVSALPEARGKGIVARLLMLWVTRAVQAKASSIALHVHPQQTSAVRLYLRQGFKVNRQDPQGLYMVWIPSQ